jgi:hypothetical protein
MLCDQVNLDVVTRRLDTERADVSDLCRTGRTMARFVLYYKGSHRGFAMKRRDLIKGATIVPAASGLLCVTGINDAEAAR